MARRRRRPPSPSRCRPELSPRVFLIAGCAFPGAAFLWPDATGWKLKQNSAARVESIMKTSAWLSGWAVLGCALLSACSTSPMSRIDANRGRYESWPVEVQEAVLNGRAIKGMTKEQVEMALGKPTEVVARSAKAGEDEVWVYRKGGGGVSSLLGNTGVSIGGGVGGVGVGTGVGGGGRQTPEETEVVFANGVVIRSG